MQLITVKKTDKITSALRSVTVVKGKKKLIEFGNLDDIIRVAEDRVHKLYCALCETAADLEILRFKKNTPPEHCVKEFPPILLTLDEMEKRMIAERQEMAWAKEWLSRLQFEREFIKLKKRKQKK